MMRSEEDLSLKESRISFAFETSCGCTISLIPPKAEELNGIRPTKVSF